MSSLGIVRCGQTSLPLPVVGWSSGAGGLAPDMLLFLCPHARPRAPFQLLSCFLQTPPPPGKALLPVLTHSQKVHLTHFGLPTLAQEGSRRSGPHTHTHVHGCTWIQHTRAHRHRCTAHSTCLHKHTHTHTHKHMYAHTSTHKHTCTCMHTHVHCPSACAHLPPPGCEWVLAACNSILDKPLHPWPLHGRRTSSFAGCCEGRIGSPLSAEGRHVWL